MIETLIIAGKEIKIDSSKPYQFLYMSDHGSRMDGDGYCCPHCGADCRYVYHWAEYGQIKGAAAGCFAALTGKIKKDDLDEFMVKLSISQTKNKPLNGWQKSVIRMLGFIEQGKYQAEWCNQKIWEAVKDQKQFAAKKWGGR